VIRLLLADDHALVREGLKRILAAASDIEVVGEAANGDETLALVKQHDFDLALVDLSMPGLSGLDLIKRLRLEKPKLRILVLSNNTSPNKIEDSNATGRTGLYV